MDTTKIKVKKKEWSEPKLIKIDKVANTAACGSGGADGWACEAGGAALGCGSGSSAMFS